VSFVHLIVVPTVIFNACGLKAKPPLAAIETFMVVGIGVGVGGVGVGLGFGVGFGVGVGVARAGVGVGTALVGVGLGFDCVGVTLGCVDVGEGAVFVAPSVATLVLVDVGVLVATGLLPPQPASTSRRAPI
jgi:hypothetical protein